MRPLGIDMQTSGAYGHLAGVGISKGVVMKLVWGSMGVNAYTGEPHATAPQSEALSSTGTGCTQEEAGPPPVSPSPCVWSTQK